DDEHKGTTTPRPTHGEDSDDEHHGASPKPSRAHHSEGPDNDRDADDSCGHKGTPRPPHDDNGDDEHHGTTPSPGQPHHDSDDEHHGTPMPSASPHHE